MTFDNASNFALLASGTGSNAVELAKTAKQFQLPLKGLICNREQAPVIEKIENLGFAVKVIVSKGIERSVHEQSLLKVLKDWNAEWIFLAGYMRVLGESFLKAFKDPQGYFRVVNIHPSLLPKFPGVNGIKDAFESGDKISGVTVHLVDEGVDTGPILAQEIVGIDSQDSLESFSQKIHACEHKIYPEVLLKIMQKALIKGPSGIVI